MIEMRFSQPKLSYLNKIYIYIHIQIYERKKSYYSPEFATNDLSVHLNTTN